MKSRIIFFTILFVLGSNFTLAQDDFAIKLMNGFAVDQNDGQRNYVQVGWQTTLEKGFNYYELQRRVSTGVTWQTLGKIDTLITADSLKSYSFSDYSVSVDSYDYRVRICLNDTPRVYITIGVVTVSSLTRVPIVTNRSFPAEYETIANYPNPFNPSTKITFILPVSEWVSVEIFDLLGNKISLIAEGLFAQGAHQFQWNASQYPSGIYLCALRTKSGTKLAKLLLQK